MPNEINDHTHVVKAFGGAGQSASTIVSNEHDSFDHLAFRPEPISGVGHIEILPEFWVGSEHRPNIVSRFFMRLLLGWKWVDH